MEFKLKDEVLTIEQDGDCESPRRWDDVGKMLCSHKRYTLGDEIDFDFDSCDGWEEVKEKLEKEYNAVIVLPLYLYDHSGISIKVGSWIGYTQHAEWDSRQVGFIYADKETIEKEYGKINKKTIAQAENSLRNEVKVYNDYLVGNAWGFKIEKINKCDKCGTEHKEIIDSCHGFIGDVLECGMLENIPKEWHKLIKKEL